jgi:hypothetical protein
MGENYPALLQRVAGTLVSSIGVMDAVLEEPNHFKPKTLVGLLSVAGDGSNKMRKRSWKRDDKNLHKGAAPVHRSLIAI